MTYNAFLNALNACSQGQVHFNQGLIYAFLFRKKWYPLRAIVNYANQTNHLTKDQSQREFIGLLTNVKIRECNLPINLQFN